MIKIEVASARTCEEDEKKYVLYIVRVSKESEEQIDSEPSEFARRYTQFSDLYNNLKRDFPSPMSTVNFPKKVLYHELFYSNIIFLSLHNFQVLLGNFDLKVIMSRTSGFVTFLEHIAKDVRLREAPCTINFFQQPELTKAKKLMEEKKYDQALSILEDNFKLLNKVISVYL